MKLSDKYIKLLKCINCDATLTISKSSTPHKKLICTKCYSAYEVKNNKIFFEKHYFKVNSWQNVGANWPNLGENSEKYKTKKIYGPKIENLPNYLNITNEGGLVYIGSGNDQIKGFINVDLGDYKNVDIVADIGKMPFKSEKLDLIVSNSTLEHIYDYKPVIKEAYRTLKLGGYIYMSVPNICPRHHTVDYHRWTMAGLVKLFDEFQIVELSQEHAEDSLTLLM